MLSHRYTVLVTLLSNDAKYNYRYQKMLKPTAVVNDGDTQALMTFIRQGHLLTYKERK